MAGRLRDLLEQLFQYDRSDLDFGIYRVLNQRRDEIRAFLDTGLMAEVDAAFAAVAGQDAALRRQLREAEDGARAAGIDPDDAPKVVELRARLSEARPPADLADQVCADLDRFLRRYYHGGDFLSLRRYRPGTYAVPYEGEEVLLHWANRDQYYVKSSESLASYAFRLPGGRLVRLRVIAADDLNGGVKPTPGEARRFVVAPDPVRATSDRELTLRFVYAPAQTGVKQADLNAAAAARILADEAAEAWRADLAAPAPGGGGTTVLLRHLSRFTARNTHDYFIHKDLRAFLRRELDTFVKTEILRVDELESMEPGDIDRVLARVRVVRQIAHQVIDFLAQAEEFQRRVWLKRKLVLEESWLVTLDLVPASLYPVVAASDAQRRAWVELLAIDRIGPDDGGPGYGEPLGVAFLRAHPELVLDTRHFDRAFVDELLGSLADVDAATVGVLVHAESFQALSLLVPRYRDGVRCVFIDPPYNTGGDGFLYKDTYRHSSWLAMMADRLATARELMAGDGALVSSIDDNEQPRLRLLLDQVFGAHNFVANVIWQKRYSPSNDARYFSDDHDHLLVYARDREAWRPAKLERSEAVDRSYKNPDADPRGPWRPDNYKANKSKEQRPKLWYLVTNPHTGTVVWPHEGATWRYSQEQHERNEAEGRVWWGKDGENDVPAFKRFLSDVSGVVPRTIWLHGDAGHNQDGVRDLQGLFGASPFVSPKPVRLMRRVLAVAPGEVVLDFFAGSGTLGQAVLDAAREAGAPPRRFVLVEAGPHFETVLRPRIVKALHAGEWRDGAPVARAGVSGIVRSVRLEAYEDALDNVRLRRTEPQQELLDASGDLHRDYLLRYLLGAESGGARVPAEALAAPDAARVDVTVDGVVTSAPVDLPATFAWLLGLRLRRVEAREGMRTMTGVDALGRELLVVWRDRATVDSSALEAWLGELDPGLRAALDVIYVNGDCTLERVRGAGERWSLRMIEEDFERLMFERADAERPSG